MNYNLDIQKILLESEKLKDFDDRIEALKQAIKIADANRDLDWGFDLRLGLIQIEQYTNHSRESIPAFAWILDVHDSNPGMFSNNDVLNEYKWVAGVVFNNLNITLEQADYILDDFRRRLLKSEYSSREYFNIRINQSLFKGEKVLAREYLDLRNNEAHDNMTSEPNDLITAYYVEMIEGDFDNSFKFISQYPTSPASEKPSLMPIYCGLIYYLGGKAFDRSIDTYFNEADEIFSDMNKYPFQLYEVSLLMYYMAKFRQDRAWEYFETFINWEMKAEDSVRFDFALSILPLLKNGGQRTIESIGIRQPYYRDDNVYELSDLYEYYLNIASDLASQFDKRNGSKHFSQQLDEEMSYLNNI